MKKKTLLALLASLSIAGHAVAQGTNPQPGDSIGNDGGLVGVSPGVISSDSSGYVRPIPGPFPGSLHPLAPARPHYVGLNGHTLYTNGQFDGYTLYIINDVNAVVYTTEVWADEQTVALPEWLTGTYTLVFADDDGGCYYGEIEL